MSDYMYRPPVIDSIIPFYPIRNTDVYYPLAVKLKQNLTEKLNGNGEVLTVSIPKSNHL